MAAVNAYGWGNVADRMPIIVLAGSDSRLGAVPQGMRREQMLAGPKGTLPLPNGRCLAAELISRLRASECFEDPLLLGPHSWYADRVDCEIIPVEGTLIHTLRRLSQLLNDRFVGAPPVAVTACDILPSAGDFQRLLQAHYAPHAQTMFWWQMIQAEADQMGASSWKPSYLIPPDRGQPPLRLYPGHLVVVRPEALRFQLINRLLELAYRERNRVLEKRYLGVVRGAIGALIAHDMRNLTRGQLPFLTCILPYVGLRDLVRHRRGTATLRDHEMSLAKTFLHRRYQRAGRPVVISTTTLLSFAKDIDTAAELEELELS